MVDDLDAIMYFIELKSRPRESTIVNSIRLVSFTFHIPLPSGYV
jgi:hypothetical protein